MAKEQTKFLRNRTLNMTESLIMLVVVLLSCLGFLRLGSAWAQFKHWETELHSKSRLNQCFAQSYLSHRVYIAHLCEASGVEGEQDCDESMREAELRKENDLDGCLLDYLERGRD